MQDKKKQILEAAIRCFARKGFRASSIQEIVDELGMAKGSIYFYFKSKNDLFVSVLEHYSDLLVSEMEELPGERELPAIRRLELQLERQYRFFRTHLDFVQMLFRESGGVGLHPRIERVMLQFRARHRIWTIRHMRALYGEAAEPYLSDLVVLFSGLSMHVMESIFTERIEMDEAAMSRYIVRRLEDVARGLFESGDRAIVPLWDWDALHREADWPATDPGRDGRWQAWMTLKERIAAAAERNPARREELMEAAACLERELERPTPNRMIVRGVLLALRELGAADDDVLAALQL